MTAETPRSAAPELPTAPASPQVDPEPTPTTNGPLAANLDAVLADHREDESAHCCYWHDGCGYGWDLGDESANADQFPRHLVEILLASEAFESLIAARVDAALGEVERRIEAEKWQFRRVTGASAGDVICRTYEDATRLVRDYREDRR